MIVMANVVEKTHPMLTGKIAKIVLTVMVSTITGKLTEKAFDRYISNPTTTKG